MNKSMRLTEIWHFHRPELARLYLHTLDIGMVTSTTIFAPRRAGKTSFLLKDLAPAAQQSGYAVAYADLWQTRLSPGVAIIRALEQALEPKRAVDRLLRKVSDPIKKIKAKAELPGAKLEGEIELGESSLKMQTEMALQIDVLIEKLCKKSPLLLLVDEAQELAKTREHETVATALRTAMTKHQAKLRVVFTGSSRSQLSHVFSNSDAPLYSTGAAIVDFPQLNRSFVEFVAGRFEASTGRKLAVGPAWKAFLEFHQQPEPFLMAVVSMVLSPGLSLKAAMADVAARQALSENHEGVWVSLNATQKALVRMLAENPNLKPFSRAVVLQLRESIGVDTLEVTHVQRAMSQLETKVARSPRGTYEFENVSFAEWVRTMTE